MYTFLEIKFHENYNGDTDFSPKITIFEKITTKNTFFAIFLLQQARKNQNLKKKKKKLLLKGLIDFW